MPELSFIKSTKFAKVIIIESLKNAILFSNNSFAEKLINAGKR